MNAFWVGVAEALNMVAVVSIKVGVPPPTTANCPPIGTLPLTRACARRRGRVFGEEGRLFARISVGGGHTVAFAWQPTPVDFEVGT